MTAVASINTITDNRSAERSLLQVLILVFATIIVLAPIGALIHSSLSGAFLLTFFAAGLFLVGAEVLVYGRRADAALRQSMTAYNAYLEGFDPITLKRARVSPELDERSRGLVAAFLNERYPGWSFSGCAPVACR